MIPVKKYFKIIFCFVLISPLFSRPTVAVAKPAVAVYSLKTNNVDRKLIDMMNSSIHFALLQAWRDKMPGGEESLKVQFEGILLDCDSNSCLFARLDSLGVNDLLTGSFHKLGETCMVNLQLVYKAPDETKNIVTTTFTGSEKELEKNIEKSIAELIGQKLEMIALKDAENKKAESAKRENEQDEFIASGGGDVSGMVFIKGGSFVMGDSAGSGSMDELPAHKVTVSNFFIDKYEVTQAEYRKIMGENPSYFRDCDNCPVENVSWNNAWEYCRKVKKRLPTEAEWEYAARGGGKDNSARDINLDAYAWYLESETHPVGRKKPNKLGIYDMMGNVWEWCNDWYDGDYYSVSEKDNPTGPIASGGKVIRGGSWSDDESEIRPTVRDWNNPDDGYYNYGFRCAKPAN